MPRERGRRSTRLARHAEFERLGWDRVQAGHPAVIQASARAWIADQPLAVERDSPDVDLTSTSPAHVREPFGRLDVGAHKDAVGLGRLTACDPAPDESPPVETMGVDGRPVLNEGRVKADVLSLPDDQSGPAFADSSAILAVMGRLRRTSSGVGVPGLLPLRS